MAVICLMDELQPSSLLCPWDSPGKNTGVGCHALLQGIFLIQGLNPHLLCLLHCRQVLYPLNHLGSPQKVGLSCLTLCDSMDYSLPGSSVHGTLQVRILERVAMPSSRGSSRHRDQTCIFCIAGGFFTTEPQGKPLAQTRTG